jgi:glutaconate CoA-transferase, subunit A
VALFLSLREAISEYVRDGSVVALEGFTHLIPFAAGHELIRQRKRGLHLVRMTPDIVYDQLIGMGCAEKLTFSWGGNPGVGSLHRLRDAVERGWPRPLELDERTHADMVNGYVAGASGLPFAISRNYGASELPRHNRNLRSITCPFTGEQLAAVPAIRTDTTIIHAQRADRGGNVLLWGIIGVQKEAALAAHRVIVTVEEIVDSLGTWPNACVLPGWSVSAIAEQPGGAYPSYAHGYYERDNDFYRRWDEISRSRDRFAAWMQQHVLDTADFGAFKDELDRSWRRQ